MLRNSLYKQSYYNKLIFFEDPNIQNWAISNFDKDHDGLLTKEDLAAVTDAEFNASGLNNISNIQNFNELKYFTGLNSISIPITVNGDITLPNKNIIFNSIQGRNLHITNFIDSNYLSFNKIYLYDNALLPINRTFQNYNVNEYIVHKSCKNYIKENHQLIRKENNVIYRCDKNINTPIITSNKAQIIANYAFFNSSFTEIKVSSSTNRIGSYFPGVKTQIIDIPENVTVIGDFFCSNNNYIQKIIFRGRTIIQNNAFSNTNKNFTIYVRDKDIEYYKRLFNAPYNTYVKSITELTE